MKRRFPDLDPDHVEAVIERVAEEMAPSRDRTTLNRKCVKALQAAMRKRVSVGASR